jgi:hypothetical protein
LGIARVLECVKMGARPEFTPPYFASVEEDEEGTRFLLIPREIILFNSLKSYIYSLMV